MTIFGRFSSTGVRARQGHAHPWLRHQSTPTPSRWYAPGTISVIFFKSNGPLLIHRLEPRQTIDHEYYIDNYLRPIVDEIKRQRPSRGTRGIKVHRDNGKPHVHQEVVTYLESEGLTVVPHPPNSPDLSPCDFWLFDLTKKI
jgi:hypothetical protein